MGGPQILVVEDESIVAMDLRQKLLALGYCVPAVTGSGEEAVEIAGRIRPDLVLMDIKLNGELDGIEAGKQIRDQHDLAVVYVTAYADEATLERAKFTEASGYLLKPVDQRTLQTAVKFAVYKHSMEKKLKDKEHRLSDALNKAREADRLKSQLLSTVSHELRNPLAAIKGFATMLLDTQDELEQAKKREFLQEIDAASDRLTILIDHLLEFARLEAGMLPIKPVPTDLKEVVAGALGHLKIRAPEKPVSLRIHPGLPRVAADPQRLRQVFDNLLDNALKYTPALSSIEIDGVEDTEDSNPVVRISVMDSGPGIPKEQLERIFEPFQQSGENSGPRPGGVGLGLAICRRIIQAHGGHIWAESANGHGATFVITMPVAN